MRLTQLFVNRPPLVFVLVAVVALAGVAHEGGSAVVSAATRKRSRASPTSL